MVMKLRKKPIEVEGVRWTGNNLDELKAFVGDALICEPTLQVRTLEGDHSVVVGAVVVKGVKGEFYPVDPKVFPDTFLVEEEDASLEALSTDKRADLKDSDFAVPEKRKLPINDETHIRLAWNFLAHTKDLTSAEKKKARGAILAAAKRHEMDTSDWEWPSLEAEEVSAAPQEVDYPPLDAVPYLLNQGAEEACELGKAFAKSLRFGLSSVDPKSGESGRERIRNEANDVLGLLFILNDELSSRGIAPIAGVGENTGVMASVTKRLGNLQKEHEAGRYSLPIPSTKEV